MVEECTYDTRAGCSTLRWVRVPNYDPEYFCLPGWQESRPKNCGKAICNPPCQFSGTCTSPNKCTCTGGNTGPSCEGRLCSHSKPCYPGTCSKDQSGSGSTCTCSFGFEGSTAGSECLTLDEFPEICQCRFRISKFSEGMEMYNIILDSAFDTTEIWTNRKDFNRIDYTGIAVLNPLDLPPVPSDYISDVKLGIVGGSFNTVHIKSGNINVQYPDQAVCDDTGVNKDNPKIGIFNCTIKNQPNSLQVQSGDSLKTTFTVKAGGYRQLINIDTKQNEAKQYYTETNMSKTLTYKFDFVKPTHCYPNCPNDETPLEIVAASRQTPLNITWKGWEDQPSGVFRYSWEIFRLEANDNGELHEPHPLSPIVISHVDHADHTDYPTYSLTAPGLYSIILEVSDVANNSVYVRRFSLYDPHSTIQLSDDKDSHLRVTSATPESNFTWHGNLDGIIPVKWTNYFFNEVIEQGHLLNKILDYPPQFVDEGPSEVKRIADEYKNTAGRTHQAVSNSRGIIKFQIGHHHDSNGGKNKPAAPTVWTDLADPISTQHTLNVPVSNGDTVVVYVKAIDPTGRERVESTQVNFDSTPPVVTQLDFELTPNKNAPEMTSSLSCAATDPDSGVLLISWRAVRLDTNTKYATGQIMWPTKMEECSNASQCICNDKFDECFNRGAQLSFDNCQMAIAGLSNSVTVELRFSVMNQAMIGSSESVFKINDIREVSNVCAGPAAAGLSGGAIAGIIIGVILIIAIAVLIFLFLTNRQPFTKSRKERGSVYIRNMTGKSTATNQSNTTPSYS
ncbi:hypothetical protein SNE40_023024 [Patella caerulea]|uniref:EGF-like domain-containing protein n=1 Tax=Patella caerulea TaxID=87958 RepID=A0AAN8J019_PATCE